MLIFSNHLRKHLEDIRNYMKGFNDIDPLGSEVLSFLERVKGTLQVPNTRLGEIERWRVIIHFKSCAKIRYIIAKNKNNEL
ncbi:hypothetical protein DJ527_13045, partial [Sulfolobus sp. F1]